MRIINAYITGFGALCEKNVDFNPDLSSILEDNGTGKSTLADFIRAMLYSFPTASKTHTVENNGRLRYAPWNSDAFGGRLTFSVGTKVYTAIRSFDRKSKTHDRFELIDAKSGKPSDDFSENLGEDIFGINEEGFLRSTYSNGTPSLSALPPSVRSKISEQMDSAEDISEFDSAQNLILSAIKEINGRTKGIAMLDAKIYEAKSEVEKAEKALEIYNFQKQKILELESQLKKLENERLELEKQIDSAQGAEANKIRFDNYNKLCNKIESFKADKIKIEQSYGGRAPEESELAQIAKYAAMYKSKTILLSSKLEETKQEDFRGVFERFKNSAPSDYDIEKLRNNIDSIKVNSSKMADCKKEIRQKNQILSELHIKNVDQIPDAEQLAQIVSGYSRSVNAPAAYKKINPVFYVIGAMMVLGGIAAAFVNLIVGTVLAGVGAVLLIALLLLAAVRKTVSGVSSDTASEQSGLQASELLIKFGFSPNADLYSAINTLNQATDLKKDISSAQAELEKLQKLSLSLNEDVLKIAKIYMVDDDDAISAGQKLIKLCESYYEWVLPDIEELNALKKEAAELESELKASLAQIGVDAQDDFDKALEKARQDARDYMELITELEEKTKEAEQSFENDKISEISLENTIQDITTLKCKREELDKSIDFLKQQLVTVKKNADLLEHNCEALSENSEEIERLTVQKQELSDRLSLLNKTLEFLISAKDSLTAKYAQSVERNFKEYSQSFLAKTGNGVTVSPELEISVKENVIAHSPLSFSSGQQSVMDVCLRLSLVDAMFQNEKPFVILDDPFALMDKQNLSDALALIKNASRDKQIIYLTCHPSREIK